MLYGYLFTRGEAGQNMGMLIIVEFLRGLPFLEPVNDWCDYFRFFQVDCPLSVALALQEMIACCQSESTSGSQRMATFGSVDLCAFFMAFLTIFTCFTLNFGQLGELVTCLNPYSSENRS